MLFKIIKLTTIFSYWLISVSAQTKDNDSIIKSLSIKWHITGNAYISAIDTQLVPYANDSILVSIYMGPNYYEFPQRVLDSLLIEKHYITDTDAIVQNVVYNYRTKIPPPPAIAKFDTTSYTIISKEEYLKINHQNYIIDSIRLSYVEKEPEIISNKILLMKYLNNKIFADAYSEITINDTIIKMLTHPNFESFYKIESISYPSKYIAVIKTKGENQPHSLYIIDSYHNLFLAPGDFGYVVSLKRKQVE